MSKNKIDLSNVSMSGFDDIFGNNAENIPVIKVALSELHEFFGHPFRVIDEQLTELVDSIKESGVLEPGIVRPRKKGGYEIISGHRRKRACELAGLKEMPVRVMDYSDDEAVIIMVDANIHRDVILPSEKAYSYAMKFEAMKHQGKSGGKTLEELSDSHGEGEKTIQRYIWLSRLDNRLMGLVDTNKIPLMAGVELSFLPWEYQELIFQSIDTGRINTVSLAQASAIRAKYKERGAYFDEMDLSTIPFPQKEVKQKPFKFKKNRVTEFFPPETSSEEMEEVIYKLLEEWKNSRTHEAFTLGQFVLKTGALKRQKKP